MPETLDFLQYALLIHVPATTGFQVNHIPHGLNLSGCWVLNTKARKVPNFLFRESPYLQSHVSMTSKSHTNNST